MTNARRHARLTTLAKQHALFGVFMPVTNQCVFPAIVFFGVNHNNHCCTFIVADTGSEFLALAPTPDGQQVAAQYHQFDDLLRQIRPTRIAVPWSPQAQEQLMARLGLTHQKCLTTLANIPPQLGLVP